MLISIALGFALAAAPITVITASSTNDAPAACLLDGKCTWKPSGGADRGVDEGIGLRFREPLSCEQLEVELNGVVASAPVDASFGAYGRELVTKDGGKTWRANCYPSTSLFLRVLPATGAAGLIEIKSIRFLTKDKPLKVDMPKSVKATVTASSVLAPTTAYQPAFLFDSKTDLAWATDGKKTDGKGATLSITFEEPQEIAGVIVWNGYQRSEPHYTSNSRPSMISIKAGGGKSAQVTLDTSVLSWDELKFVPLPASKNIEVVIDAVQKGEKYKDLVISELRFLDANGRVIAPAVEIEKTAPPAALAPLLNTSYAGAVALMAPTMTACVDRRVRVRGGGSFVIYTGDENSPEGTGVIEGGWNAGKTPTSLRVFGKRYRTVVMQGEYAGLEEIVPEIFQSDLKLTPFASLSAAEQAKIVDVVYDLTSSGDRSFKDERKAFARDGSVLASAATYAELKKALAKALADKGALAAQSSVYTDALLPTDVAGACKR